MKVSIVMSTYNESQEQLKKAIESMLKQTFKDFEFIIILDNPKNELHKKIINEYKKKDKRIKFVVNENNIGLAASLNKGINIAKGKYIARMDADDISHKERLKKEYEFLEKNLDIDIVSTNRVNIDEDGNVLKKAKNLPDNDIKIKKTMKHINIIVHSAVMFRKEKINKIGNYRNFPCAQDYDLWLRACNNKYKFSIINEYLIEYRIRQNNITNTNPLKQWITRDYIYELYKQRVKKGKDNFSEENLQKYLIKHKAFDKKEIFKYKKGIEYIELAKLYMKKKSIFKFLFYILKAAICGKKTINVMWHTIISVWMGR